MSAELRSMVDFVAFGSAASLAFVVAVVAWRRRDLPRGIVRRLSAGAHEVRVRSGSFTRSMTGVWNPAKPFSPGTLIFGRGVATYTLRGDEVHVRWQPRRGPVQEFAGPVPPYARPDRARDRRVRRGVLVALGAYFGILAASGVGVGVATGSASDAALAVLGAMAVLPLVSTALRARRRTLRT